MNKIRKEIKSFGHALAGLRFLIKNENHFKFHVFAAILVISLGLFFDIILIDWCILFICIGVVMSIEAMNTAIEELCNHMTQEQDEHIKLIKDISAGAVLITSISAAICGLIIFYPYIVK